MSEIRNILLLKHFSVGLGDVIRSTASWKSIKEKFPDSAIHIFFLSSKPGSASEYIFYSSPYVESFKVVRKVEKKNYLGRYIPLSEWKAIFSEMRSYINGKNIDVAVDQEPHGIENGILSLWLRLNGIKTLGIMQYPGKNIFYSMVSPSMRKYAKKEGKMYPLEYTERDYVSLYSLGIRRLRTQVEVPLTKEGETFSEQFIAPLKKESNRMLIGVNIGCGPNAIEKRRPNMPFIIDMFMRLHAEMNACFVLTGTTDEVAVNKQILYYLQQGAANDLSVVDFSGKTNIGEFSGLIYGCDAFISTDSGPFHLSVALKTPTIGLFKVDNPTCYHHNEYTRNLVVDDYHHHTGYVVDALREIFHG